MVVTIRLIALIIFIFFSNYSYSGQKIQIIRDAEIEFFLHKLIKLTIEDSKNQNYHPRLVLNSDYNAFVTGSNKIYINTGLINNSNSLSEIQAILAHEIGHLALNHYSTRLVNAKNLSNYSKLATLTGIALSTDGKLDTNSAVGLMIGTSDLAKKSLLQFSRIQEQQADKYALDQLIKKKISLTGLEKLLKNLANEERTNLNISPIYYRSHPFSKQRLEQVKRYKLQYQNVLLKEQKVSINENVISLQYIKNKIKSYNIDPYEIHKEFRKQK
jgi:Putative Zn-dependent protease, contains TPR repeats